MTSSHSEMRSQPQSPGQGHRPHRSQALRHADTTAVAKSFAAAAPERMVWGSDWPHRGEKHMPDDARLLDLLAEWIPDDRARVRVLVDNPATLYGFN